MNTAELRDFIEWLNVQTDFTIDPVSTEDPDELIAAYLERDGEGPYDDLAHYLFRRLDGIDQHWSKSQRDWYRRLAEDVADFITEEWTDLPDPVVVSAGDLRTFMEYATRTISRFEGGHTRSNGPVTRRLLDAIEEVGG